MRQLMVRRRSDDQYSGTTFTGYDEIIDGKNTGRVILSWSMVGGEIVYTYDDDLLNDDDMPDLVKSTLSPLEPLPDIAVVLDESFSTKYILSFDWEYGHESVELDSEADAVPYKKAILAKYGHFNPINWTLKKVFFKTEDLDFPGVKND